MSETPDRITAISVDTRSLAALSEEAEHERRAAIYDLTSDNQFALVDGPAGPYTVVLSTQDNHLVMTVKADADDAEKTIGLSLSPFRRIVRDYLMMCESYYTAMREARPEQIETVDMARRATHNEGADLILERLDGKVVTDHETARRLFTLLCSLYRPR